MKLLLLTGLLGLPALPALAQLGRAGTPADSLACSQLIGTYLTGMTRRDTTQVGRTLAPEATVSYVLLGTTLPTRTSWRSTHLVVLSKVRHPVAYPPASFRLRYLSVAPPLADALVTQPVADTGQGPACHSITFDFRQADGGWQITRITVLAYPSACP